jgi:hypothetical protein
LYLIARNTATAKDRHGPDVNLGWTPISIREPLNKVEFVGPVVLNVDFADMRFQNSD